MINCLKANIRLFQTKRRFPKAVIYPGVEISSSSSLEENVVIFNSTSIINSTILDNTYIQKNSVIINTKIGMYCSIASNVHVGNAEHPTHFVSTSPIFYDNNQPLPEFLVDRPLNEQKKQQTIIGNAVWIGHGVIIKSGINIGTGAIIGAGAVVVKDVEPYSIVVGVPAKHVKWRFSETIRNGLLSSKWWELPKSFLSTLQNEFEIPEIFLKKINLVNNENKRRI
jgi:acetyltransferase-like isoleucine patch superfamily enzyme